MRRVVLTGMLPVIGAIVLIVASVADAPAERSQIGVASAGRNAIEFVGHAEQSGLSFDSYGYLTHVVGLDEAALFSDPNPAHRNEKTARFTFRGATQVSQRFAVLAGAVGGPTPSAPSVLDVDSAGSETFYFDSDGNSGRSFGNPASFTTGAAVASYGMRFQDSIAALVGIDPSRGVLSGTGELCQRSASAFHLAGQELRIGRAGLFQRVATHGWSVLTSPTPTSFANLAGNTQVFDSEDCRALSDTE